MLQKITVPLFAVGFAFLYSSSGFSAVQAGSGLTPLQQQHLSTLPRVIIVRSLRDTAGRDLSAEIFELNLKQRVASPEAAELVAKQLDNTRGEAVQPDNTDAIPLAISRQIYNGRASNAVNRWSYYGSRGYYGVYGYGYRPYYGSYYGYPGSTYGYYYSGYSYPYSYYPYSYYRYPYSYSYYYNPYYYSYYP